MSKRQRKKQRKTVDAPSHGGNFDSFNTGQDFVAPDVKTSTLSRDNEPETKLKPHEKGNARRPSDEVDKTYKIIQWFLINGKVLRQFWVLAAFILSIGFFAGRLYERIGQHDKSISQMNQDKIDKKIIKINEIELIEKIDNNNQRALEETTEDIRDQIDDTETNILDSIHKIVSDKNMKDTDKL